MQGLLSGIEFIFRGGLMMYPLLIAAFLALTVIIERIYIFQKRYSTPENLVTQVLEHLLNNQTRKASLICKDYNTPVASVLAAGVENFDHPMEEMELAMKNEAEEWVQLLEKRIEVIDTVITAAPLMGLLGTITGMMGSFQVLSQKGVNEPNAITGGVAEALIATATGLIIALLCLVAYNYLSARIKNYIGQLETSASRLIQMRLVVQRRRQEISHETSTKAS